MDSEQEKKRLRYLRFYGENKEKVKEARRRYYRENKEKWIKYREDKKKRMHVCDCGAVVRVLSSHLRSKIHEKRLKMKEAGELNIVENTRKSKRGDAFDVEFLNTIVDVEGDLFYDGLENDEERKLYLEHLLKEEEEEEEEED